MTDCLLLKYRENLAKSFKYMWAVFHGKFILHNKDELSLKKMNILCILFDFIISNVFARYGTTNPRSHLANLIP